MSSCIRNREICTPVNDFMSTFRTVLDSFFVKKDHTINAQLVMNELKQKKINIEQIKIFLDTLPKEEWSIKTFLDNIEKLNDFFGISDEEINKWSVNQLNEKDVLEIRFRVVVESMIEYTRFASEFYDALKYNTNNQLSMAKIKLLNELMMVFKYIKEQSKMISEHFKNRKYSIKNLNDLNVARLPIEFLVLRILYISMNLAKSNDKMIVHYAELLSKERISLIYQKVVA